MTDLNNSNTSSVEDGDNVKAPLERDFYGCYCLKFRIKHGSSITEEQILSDFEAYGEVLDVWGAGFVYKESSDLPIKYTDRLDSEVNVRFTHRRDAKEALSNLQEFYHELTPAISDVLPDNHGTFTISFENKMAIPTNDLFIEFSKYGEIKSITGALNIKMGRIFVSYWSKESAIKAFLNKTERWFMNMRFILPRCEKDYFGTYCMKFYNTQGTHNYASEMEVRDEFGRYGEVVDIRGPGLFDVVGNDVYVRYWEKTSAQTALTSLVGRYESLCITPGTDIQPDRWGMWTLTFVNKHSVSEDEVWQIFHKFGRVTSVVGTFDLSTGRIFLSYEDKEAALRALQAMLTSRQFKVQVANSCKPQKFPKSVNNYYGAATMWKTSEFPRKRKVRNEEELDEDEKWGRRQGDWFFRRGESGERGKSKRARHNSFKITQECEEKIGNEEDTGASYSYRAPFKNDIGGAVQEEVGGQCSKLNDEGEHSC